MIKMLIIACLGILLFASDGRSAQEIVVNKASKINVKPEFWDFGKITELKVLSRDFEVKNTGNDVLTIKNITTSCGCTTVSISSKDISSGHSATPNREVKVSHQAKIVSVPKISSRKLHALIKKGKRITILDVREENEYIGKHIPEAIWFPKSKFDKQDPEVLKKLEGIDKKTMVVTYCGAGHRSSYVTKKLREAGYNAYNLDGVSF